MTPKAQPAPRAFDPRSAVPTLRYVGGEVRGVPARDLSDADLAAAAFAALAPEARPTWPTDLPDAALAALRDELVATGHYVKED